MTKLTKAQIETIKRQLDDTGELPAEWRWDIFPPEKQEYELVYAAKQREEDIIAQTMAVPLQNLRTFNNGSGQPKADEWYNKLIFGDNSQSLKTLISDRAVNGKVKLVYIDPPFATKHDFKGSQDQKAYQDKVVGAQFLEFLRKRFLLIREILSEDGFLVVHIDYRYGHYAKILLDELFPGNFRNDIKVPRGTKNVQSQFEQISALSTGDDSLLLFSKRPSTKIKHLRIELNEQAAGKWDTFWRGTDRPTMRYKLFNQTPDTGQWRWKKERAMRANNNYEEYIKKFSDKEGIDDYYLRNFENVVDLDFVRLNDDGVVQYYVPPRDSRLANTIWTDIRTIGKVTAYPTEKHEQLLERIINWLTDSGDLVLDAFAGSGVTCAVAEKLGRKWIGIDCGKLSIYTIQKRLLNLREDIGNKGTKINCKPFVLQSSGLYDFNSLKDLPWEDWRFFALQLFECRDKRQKIGGLQIDGEKGRAPVLVYDWKSNPGQTISEETIDDIHAMVGKKIGKKFYIIAPMMAFDFFQDYIDLDGIRYYALRIPYSMIQELHRRDFEAVLQAREEGNVNDIQEAYGFSFVIPPEVIWETKTEKGRDELFPWAVLKTKKFISKAIIKGSEEQGAFEALSMLMIDLDYDGNVFDLDIVLYGEELEKSKWTARFSHDDIGEQIMAVWVDHHGNESKAVISRDEFGLPELGKSNKENTKKKAVKKKAAKKKVSTKKKAKR